MPTVTIVACADRRDRSLARRLERKIAAFANVEHLSIDALAALSDSMRGARLVARVPLFIVSRSATSTPLRRHVLATGNFHLGASEFRSYYVVRGERPAVILREFSDLGPLRAAMLVTERDVDAVLRDLRQYVGSERAPSGRRIVGMFGRGLARIGLLAVSTVVNWLRLIPAMAPAAGPILLSLIAFDSGREWRWLLGLVCVSATGVILGKVQTLDFWPWLCGGVDRGVAVRRFASVLRQARLAQAFLLSAIAAMAWWTIVHENVPPWWIAAAVTFGILEELALNALLRVATLYAIAERGITPDRRPNRLFVAMRGTLRADLAALGNARAELHEDFELAVRRLMKIVTLGAFAPHRPWLPLRDRVFISYAWADDRHRRITSAVVETLVTARVPHFIDAAKESEFIPWRSAVAGQLARATHVLLVISPNMNHGQTLKLEIMTIISRWYHEALPSVICVGDDEVVDRLLRDGRLSVELWFILNWCPRISHADARDPRLLTDTIARCRRNGRLKDWLALLSPRRALVSSAPP